MTDRIAYAGYLVLWAVTVWCLLQWGTTGDLGWALLTVLALVAAVSWVEGPASR